ncbi:hypothetical protein [Zeaxanthinibacter enoshimensis]|uniref:Uncharacterized protein n=1 Tax=Zeaxanthinibacter enoshimensis TaxID=392009 RepID=A0A4R6TMA3_9FLAO|nr:hypothetical protein [Zeaxanthinibacter enoshimensis]TDQ30785.1 hypothetical protein CLV82_1474 [Zeaxanthinibacter enoshimensis]
MKRFSIFLFCITLGLLSCTDRDDELQQVQIRVRNMNSFTYDTVIVGDQESVHELVEPGAYSDYLPYDTAYRYAYIEIVAGDSTFIAQPIDFVGEDPLPAGFYTYELTAEEDFSVDLNFVLD